MTRQEEQIIALMYRVTDLELSMENVLKALNTAADNMVRLTEFVRQDREAIIVLERRK